MGLFRESITELITKTSAAVTKDLDRGAMGDSRWNGLVEKLCQQLGWRVDSCGNDRSIISFSDQIASRRQVIIDCRERMMDFCVFSTSAIPARHVPTDFMAYLLLRNSFIGVSSWRVSILANRTTALSVGASLPIQGIDVSLFRNVCLSLVDEVAAFDAKLAAAGML